ncbi:hypothetical protein TSH58p_12775 [Azospirillum sp. TSH58]|uniref:hypothetical protein n=1 Tax=Azospirillum sp. TSH58 TaxID=664962 RepID=UPI000D6008CF|nr:hypothetical protein [Azospirillum sp. TSH58]AWJ84323.1 hypothetical protein TSH58p_12775 [Azospirillum sp. TSH58]
MNKKTIVALYDDLSGAERALSELEAANLRQDFTMMGADSAKLGSSASLATENRLESWRHAADFGQDPNFDARDRRVSMLTGVGVTREDAEVFAEGVRRGGVLLVGRVDEAMCDSALTVMQRHGSVDIPGRAQGYREAGWSGYDAGTADYDSEQVAEERRRAAAASLRDVNTQGANPAAGAPAATPTAAPAATPVSTPTGRVDVNRE